MIALLLGVLVMVGIAAYAVITGALVCRVLKGAWPVALDARCGWAALSLVFHVATAVWLMVAYLIGRGILG